MRQSIREALEVIFGNAAGVLTALCGLVGVVVGVVIDPLAAAVVSAALLVVLVAIFVYALRQRALFSGPYRVLDETITWDLEKADGKTAHLIKRQRVQFNYPVIAHVELATGDGELFADFKCNFGAIIKPVRQLGTDGLLIQMIPERNRGEEADLRTSREIHDGFVGADQWIVVQASAPSKRTELIVQFPAGCDVRNVRLDGPGGHGSRPARQDELRAEGLRQVLRPKPCPYRVGQKVTVTWSW